MHEEQPKPPLSQNPRRFARLRQLIQIEKLRSWSQLEEITIICFWGLAALSIIAAIRFLVMAKPQGTATLGLLILAAICLVLSIGGGNFIRRIQRIGPGGVEIETWTDIDRILTTAPPPTPKIQTVNLVSRGGNVYTGGPLAEVPLDQQQSWFYEQGTHIILHLQYRGLNPSTLSKGTLQKYRDLMLWMGTAAINDRRTTKALEILKLLEPLEDKTSRELFMLGKAYCVDARYTISHPKKDEYLKKACNLIEEASRQDDKNPEVFFELGLMYDIIGRYELSISTYRKTIKLDAQYSPWALWGIAVSTLKDARPQQTEQERVDQTIHVLKSIPAGRWWSGIYDDSDLAKLKEDQRFSKLYQERNQ